MSSLLEETARRILALADDPLAEPNIAQLYRLAKFSAPCPGIDVQALCGREGTCTQTSCRKASRKALLPLRPAPSPYRAPSRLHTYIANRLAAVVETVGGTPLDLHDPISGLACKPRLGCRKMPRQEIHILEEGAKLEFNVLRPRLLYPGLLYTRASRATRRRTLEVPWLIIDGVISCTKLLCPDSCLLEVGEADLEVLKGKAYTLAFPRRRCSPTAATFQALSARLGQAATKPSFFILGRLILLDYSLEEEGTHARHHLVLWNPGRHTARAAIVFQDARVVAAELATTLGRDSLVPEYDRVVATLGPYRVAELSAETKALPPLLRSKRVVR
jgi:hypothetical protein